MIGIRRVDFTYKAVIEDKSLLFTISSIEIFAIYSLEKEIYLNRLFLINKLKFDYFFQALKAEIKLFKTQRAQ